MITYLFVEVGTIRDRKVPTGPKDIVITVQVNDISKTGCVRTTGCISDMSYWRRPFAFEVQVEEKEDRLVCQQEAMVEIIQRTKSGGQFPLSKAAIDLSGLPIQAPRRIEIPLEGGGRVPLRMTLNADETCLDGVDTSSVSESVLNYQESPSSPNRPQGISSNGILGNQRLTAGNALRSMSPHFPPASDFGATPVRQRVAKSVEPGPRIQENPAPAPELTNHKKPEPARDFESRKNESAVSSSTAKIYARSAAAPDVMRNVVPLPSAPTNPSLVLPATNGCGLPQNVHEPPVAGGAVELHAVPEGNVSAVQQYVMNRLALLRSVGVATPQYAPPAAQPAGATGPLEPRRIVPLGGDWPAAGGLARVGYPRAAYMPRA
eukprot:EG_transcript_10188